MQDETGPRRAANYRGWQSDVIVDLIKRYGFPHITLNPGASFRGLHDSLVNYGGNEPPMMLCQHEEIAVQIAHGYAKVTGKPMAGILHNLVGPPPAHAAATPAPMAPDPRAIAAIADKLIAAEHPMLLAEYAGRRAGGFESIVELAELTGAAVWDVNNALNFPNKHPLCLSMDKDTLRHTDLVVGLDVNDWEKQLTELNNAKRTREQLTPPSCDFVEIGFGEINISKWAMDYCRMQPCSLRALGDTALGIPELTRICKERIADDAKLAARIAARKRAVGKRHDEVWATWQ